MIWILPLILMAVSALTLLWLLIQKIPQLRVVNVDSIPKERTRKIKEQIILQKFQRVGGKRLKGLFTVATGTGRLVSRMGRRAVQRLYALEQYYQKLKRSASEGQHAYDAETIHRLIEEAETLRQKDELIPAEKMYIDIISHNPKSVDAYEGLGNLYLGNGQFDQARETLQFTLRLSPNDASVLASLAQLEMRLDQPKAALQHMKKAIQKRPKNPRYLDLSIEIALKAGSLKDAEEGIKRLKEVNPENQKIADFSERFLEQKAAYAKKGDSSTEEPSQTE